MSEEILSAIMELSALIVKQDGGMISAERAYIIEFLQKRIDADSVQKYLALFDSFAGPVVDEAELATKKAPSVRDSVKIFGICKKINRTLNQRQKVVVLVWLYELVKSSQRFTTQRMNIINTVAEVFKIPVNEESAIEQFVCKDTISELQNDYIITLQADDDDYKISSLVQVGYEDVIVCFLYVPSIDIYFTKYISDTKILTLNGIPISQKNVYNFAKGSILKSTHGSAIYYSDVSSEFLSESMVEKLSFVAENLTYRFDDGYLAVDDVTLSAKEGMLVGILGASGSGKTTLMNLLCGILKPTSGSVRLNGIDINNNKGELEGVFGYVPQDDLLIENLTVRENLFFAASQCFADKSKEALLEIVDNMLMNIGLYEKKDLKVGSVFNTGISGGQRKRLNIALELIREPSVLFLDEPTSGLSSRDSENLIHLLHDITIKGKIVFNVIHQPSSEIFKMFDKVVILDQQGAMAYYGNPVDAVVYFKSADMQINAQQGECPTCGNVNAETIFDIIDMHVVDEFGRYTNKRKVSPREWAENFKNTSPKLVEPEVKSLPQKNFKRPDKLHQFIIYLTRDLKSKLADLQYVLLTLLEAPVLGLILAFLIRYIADPDSKVYIFAENENIPIYIFMTVIVALFLGLVISAEEIFNDRKILKREKFLNLSKSSYLLSKIVILVGISIIQSLLFVMVANSILGVHGLFFRYWLAFFVTAFSANMLGLIISASFNSAINIYIVIPLLIIPMMVLSGAMFTFDKLNRKIGSVDKVPLIAEFMPTRWTYEALMVTQFKDNKYNQIIYTKDGESLYDLNKQISVADFNTVYRIPELKKAIEVCSAEYDANYFNADSAKKTSQRLALIRNEIETMMNIKSIPPFANLDKLTPQDFNLEVAASTMHYLNSLRDIFNNMSNTANARSDNFYRTNWAKIKVYRDRYHNYKLEEIVTKYYERKKVLIHNSRIVQCIDPIYLDSKNKGGLKFRTHFFAPTKCIFGKRCDTFSFNIILVLLVNVLLYAVLYYDLLAKGMAWVDKKMVYLKDYARNRIEKLLN